jgi:glutamyl/glutaminyl-tRNA synthetase
MTRCEKFYVRMRDLLETGDKKELNEFCNKNYDTLHYIEKHIEFMDNYFPNRRTSDISEFATRPLRKEPENIQKAVVKKIEKQLKKKEKPTAKQVKQWIREEKGEPIELEEKAEIKLLTSIVDNLDALVDDFCPSCPTIDDENYCGEEAEAGCPIMTFTVWLDEKGLKISRS